MPKDETDAEFTASVLDIVATFASGLRHLEEALTLHLEGLAADQPATEQTWDEFLDAHPELEDGGEDVA